MPTHGTRAILRANIRLLQSAGAITPQHIESLQKAFGKPYEPGVTEPAVNQAEAMLAEAIGSSLTSRGPLLLMGMIPSLLESADQALIHAERGQNFLHRVLIVETRLDVVASILARRDLSASLQRPDRFVMMIGDDAAAQLERWLTERIESSMPCLSLLLADEQLPDLQAQVHAVLESIASRQVARQRELITATEQQGGDPTACVLAARFALQEAAAGQRKLSILLCGSRYTTYVRHSLEGLAAALRSLGHAVELLLEQDASSTLTTLAYRRAVLETQPDLIVTVNYPRVLLGRALPNHIPHACWIQDSMPHLLDANVAQSIDDTELFIGNAMPELSDTFGYPRHTLIPSCVPACEHRFHPEPISAADSARWACDVAFVSHHSETPEAMRDRIIREMNDDRHARTIVANLWDAMPALLESAAEQPLRCRLEHAVREIVARTLGQQSCDAQSSMILHRVALPLLGRLFRHESLRWAKSICDRRGWSLRLYGNGWERTPALRSCAAGPVEHGEPLRACYQAARAHLHLDPNTLTHQRVFECAMSGGLPIARFHYDALGTLLVAAADEAHDERATEWAAIPLGRRYREACDELGLTPVNCAHAIATMPRMTQPARDQLVRVFDPHWLYAGLGDVTFHDEASLERALERAINDAAWRSSRPESMRIRMIESVGMRAFANHMVNSAGRVIGWKTACIKYGFGWPVRPDWAEFDARRRAGLDAA